MNLKTLSLSLNFESLIEQKRKIHMSLYYTVKGWLMFLLGQTRKYEKEFDAQAYESRREYLTSMSAYERSSALADMGEKRMERLRRELSEAMDEMKQADDDKKVVPNWVKIETLIRDQLEACRLEWIKNVAEAEQHLVLATMYKNRTLRLKGVEATDKFMDSETPALIGRPALASISAPVPIRGAGTRAAIAN